MCRIDEPTMGDCRMSANMEMEKAEAALGKCPVSHGSKPKQTRTNAHWWPDQLNLGVLHQHAKLGDPMLEDFDYKEAFSKLDLKAVIADLHALMTDSQDW